MAFSRVQAIRRISSALESMDPERARWLAAFAYLLGRVAHADLEIRAEEVEKMEAIVREVGHLPPDQAVLVVEIAKTQNRLLGGTQNFIVAREFRALANDVERRHLLDALFAVSAADGSITTREEAEIKKIATELGLSPTDFVAVRAQWSDHRAVLRALEASRGSD